MGALLLAALMTGWSLAPAESPPLVVQLIDQQSSDCREIVRQVLTETGGHLLSVRSHRDRCTVTILLFANGERPRKKVIRIFHDQRYIKPLFVRRRTDDQGYARLAGKRPASDYASGILSA